MNLLLVGGYLNIVISFFACIIFVAFLVHVFFYWAFRSAEIIGSTETQRLNYFLPKYDFVERHKIVIHSSPARVFEAIHNFDMRKSKVINTLLFLRSIPHRLNFNRKPDNQKLKKLLIDQLIENGPWILLEEVENQEVVIGFAGKF